MTPCLPGHLGSFSCSIFIPYSLHLLLQLCPGFLLPTAVTWLVLTLMVIVVNKEVIPNLSRK